MDMTTPEELLKAATEFANYDLMGYPLDHGTAFSRKRDAFIKGANWMREYGELKQSPRLQSLKEEIEQDAVCSLEQLNYLLGNCRHFLPKVVSVLTDGISSWEKNGSDSINPEGLVDYMIEARHYIETYILTKPPISGELNDGIEWLDESESPKEDAPITSINTNKTEDNVGKYEQKCSPLPDSEAPKGK